ncbi:hypothetical protein KA405_04335 [Patescibacteria group bacterium]|nr:hypothetical protein [Patescibacteria group bacterium]
MGLTFLWSLSFNTLKSIVTGHAGSFGKLSREGISLLFQHDSKKVQEIQVARAHATLIFKNTLLDIDFFG